MSKYSPNDVTRILHAVERGEEGALDELLPLLYDELRLLAAQKLSREAPGQTLQPTALVHEVFLRLTGGNNQSWTSRGQFFGAAAEAMRRILIDSARRKKGLKRGGNWERVGLDESLVASDCGMPVEDLLSLDEALDRLENVDPKVAQLVKLRFFAGLTGKQAGEAIGVSHNTADAYWAYARAWLRTAIGDDRDP
ncbi:MAG: sigma-70 family RNA polymerase sigma factor [Planctomycetales bacterium]|nr:sigma-70 family RNA polymerase sigma factor [Planctomycetales bacterium]